MGIFSKGYFHYSPITKGVEKCKNPDRCPYKTNQDILGNTIPHFADEIECIRKAEQVAGLSPKFTGGALLRVGDTKTPRWVQSPLTKNERVWDNNFENAINPQSYSGASSDFYAKLLKFRDYLNDRNEHNQSEHSDKLFEARNREHYDNRKWDTDSTDRLRNSAVLNFVDHATAFGKFTEDDLDAYHKLYNAEETYINGDIDKAFEMRDDSFRYLDYSISDGAFIDGDYRHYALPRDAEGNIRKDLTAAEKQQYARKLLDGEVGRPDPSWKRIGNTYKFTPPKSAPKKEYVKKEYTPEEKAAYAKKKAMEAAAKTSGNPETTGKPGYVPKGDNISFTGTITEIKEVDDPKWGKQTKFVLKDERGFTLYGDATKEMIASFKIGDKITGAASMTPSKNPIYGFFRKAAGVKKVEATED